MNKTERDELRRVVKARFKLLRSDVEQRKAELQLELEAAVVARFEADDKRWDDTLYLVQEAAREANRKANDLYREFFGPDEWGAKTDQEVIGARMVAKPTHERGMLLKRGYAEIEAKVKAALYELERREVEVLEKLAVTALESMDAKAFMDRIPTVSELVPASRLFAAIGGSQP